MMAGDPINLLIQGGLVGIFMVFVILTRREDRQERTERDQSWQTFLANQNKIASENMALVTKSLDNLVGKYEAHDKQAKESFAILIDRKNPRGKP